MTTQQKLFNPFAVFGRKVQRKFLIQPRDYNRYSESQLVEEVEHELRIFNIDGTIWYLAKDITSYLGINPKNSARALEKIEQKYIKQENITLKTDDLVHEVMPQEPNRAYKMYLISEPGIYALIQKSKTMYAELFKAWLNEQVLPSIRTSGEYKAESTLKRDIIQVSAEQDQREWELECMDEKEEKEYKEDIAFEIQSDINMARSTIVQQTQVIEQKESILIDMLKSMKADMQKDREEHKREREQDLRDKEQMKQDLFEMKTKINTIVQDRIAVPEDKSRRELFIIMSTGEENTDDEKRNRWRFPYYILRCQQGTKETREMACVSKYPQAQNVFEIAQPNNQSLYDVIKSKVEQRKMRITFYRNCFYFNDNTVNLQNIIDLVYDIEKERTSV